MPEYRTDNLKWEEYFMGIAVMSAMRSKDPSTQVGACIVDQDIPLRLPRRIQRHP